MAFVVTWIICGIIGAMIGSSKGARGTGFWLGFLLGPIGVIIAVMMKGNGPKCHFCKEELNPQATVCAHCQREQPPDSTQHPKDHPLP